MITLSNVLRFYGVVDRLPLNVKLGHTRSGKCRIMISSPGFAASYFDADQAKRLSNDLCSIGETEIGLEIKEVVAMADKAQALVAV